MASFEGTTPGEGFALSYECNVNDDGQTRLFAIFDKGGIPRDRMEAIGTMIENPDVFFNKETIGLRLNFRDGSSFHAPFKSIYQLPGDPGETGAFLSLDIPDAATEKLKSQSHVQFRFVAGDLVKDYFRAFSLKGSSAAISELKHCN